MTVETTSIGLEDALKGRPSKPPSSRHAVRHSSSPLSPPKLMASLQQNARFSPKIRTSLPRSSLLIRTAGAAEPPDEHSSDHEFMASTPAWAQEIQSLRAENQALKDENTQLKKDQSLELQKWEEELARRERVQLKRDELELAASAYQAQLDDLRSKLTAAETAQLEAAMREDKLRRQIESLCEQMRLPHTEEEPIVRLFAASASWANERGSYEERLSILDSKLQEEAEQHEEMIRAMASTHCDRLDEVKHELQVKLEAKEQTLLSLQGNLQVLQCEADAASSKQQAQYAQIVEEKEAMSAKLSAVEGLATEQRHEKEQLLGQEAALKDQLQEMVAKADSEAAHVSLLETKLQRKQAELDRANANATSELSAEKERVRTLEEENATAAACNQELERNIGQLQTKWQEQYRSLEVEKARSEQRQQKLDEKAMEEQELRRRLDEALAQLQVTDDTKHRLETERSHLSTEVDQIQELNELQQQKLAEAEGIIGKLEARIQQLEVELLKCAPNSSDVSPTTQSDSAFERQRLREKELSRVQSEMQSNGR